MATVHPSTSLPSHPPLPPPPLPLSHPSPTPLLPPSSPRSPRKGLNLMSPKNLVTNGGARQVFGFDAPHSSFPDSMSSTPPLLFSQTTVVGHSSPNSSPPTSQNVIISQNAPLPEEHSHLIQTDDVDRSHHSISKAINTKSFHTNRKISPPLNRPSHLSYS